MGSGPVAMSFTFSSFCASIAVTVPASRLVTKAIRSPAKAISWWPEPVGMLATTFRDSVSRTVTPPLPGARSSSPIQRWRPSGWRASRMGSTPAGIVATTLKVSASTTVTSPALGSDR